RGAAPRRRHRDAVPRRDRRGHLLGRRAARGPDQGADRSARGPEARDRLTGPAEDVLLRLGDLRQRGPLPAAQARAAGSLQALRVAPGRHRQRHLLPDDGHEGDGPRAPDRQGTGAEHPGVRTARALRRARRRRARRRIVSHSPRPSASGMARGSSCAVVLALLATACVSVADRADVPPEIVARIRSVPSPHFKAHMDYEPQSDDYPGLREKTLSEVRAILAESPWFDTLDADRADASLLLSIQPLERTPYWYSPAHSPGGLILMMFIPVPSEVRAGFALTATVPGSGATVAVDTRRELTEIFWSLAPLLNLLPSRSFGVKTAQEVERIHAQLLPLVEAEPRTLNRRP